MGWIEEHGPSIRANIAVKGRRSPLRKTFSTKAAARAWIRDTETDLERGVYRDPDAGAVSFEAWTVKFLATRGTLRDKSQREEASIIKNHLVPAFGAMRLDEIGPTAVRTLVSDLAKTRAPKTVRNVHGVLHSVMALALAEGLILSNPCKGSRLPANKRRKKMACLTEQQLEALISEIPEHYRPLVITLAGTGMRWAEATVGLTVGDVHLLEAPPYLRIADDDYADGEDQWEVKTEAGERTVTLPARVVDVLIPLVAGRAAAELVFTTPDGEPIKHQRFNQDIWIPAVIRAGLSVERKIPGQEKPRVLHTATPHDLRHTHAALLIARNVPLSAIKDRLGHKSIKTTDDIYGYLLPQVDRAVLKALDEALGVPAAADFSLINSQGTPTGDAERR
jgi:integrase